jgi:hypothetical protein
MSEDKDAFASAPPREVRAIAPPSASWRCAAACSGWAPLLRPYS